MRPVGAYRVPACDCRSARTRIGNCNGPVLKVWTRFGEPLPKGDDFLVDRFCRGSLGCQI